MPRKPIKIGDLEFAKQGDAISFFQEMLYRYKTGDKVTEQDGQILALLLARHPEAGEKIGPGIAYFSVKSADFGTRCFFVTRTDSTSDKFSFRACLR